jgi:hypothetical protein
MTLTHHILCWRLLGEDAQIQHFRAGDPRLTRSVGDIHDYPSGIGQSRYREGGLHAI